MKRVSPQSTIEYLLKVTPFFNERKQKYCTKFILETTKSFASFVYDLTVKERLKDNEIHLKIEGLRPPHLSIPAAGHARFEREYDTLNGTYDVILESIDGRSTTFTLQITPKKVEVLHMPRKTFVELVLDTPQN